MYIFASKYANKIETIKKQSKIGPKGFLNDVIGTEKYEVWKNFFFQNVPNLTRNKKLPEF